MQADFGEPLRRYLQAQQNLDHPTLVHRPVAFGRVLDRQLEVEHLARVLGGYCQYPLRRAFLGPSPAALMACDNHL